MTKTIGTTSEWQKALDDLALERREVLPPGWITSKEYAEMMGCEISTGQKQLRKLVQGGKAEERVLNNRHRYKLK